MPVEIATLEAGASTTEAGVVAELAQEAASPAEVMVGEVYTVPDGTGGVKVIDTDEYAEHPRHEKASRQVTDAKSFVDYVNRHRRAGTEVFAHTLSSSIVGVIDSHEAAGGDPGWQKHRVQLVLEHTKSWLAWAGRDLGVNERAWFGQVEFAEFIEANALDVRSPDHSVLIEIARTFEAKQKADFTSAVREHDGSVNFSYEETVAAKAGQKGALTIPQEFELALVPYVGADPYKVIASFRYRLNGGDLKLGYSLRRPERILEDAFQAILTEIKDGRHDKGEWPDHDGIGDVPVFSGKP